MSNIRRTMMAAGRGGSSPYPEGWIPNTHLKDGEEEASDGRIVSPYFDLNEAPSRILNIAHYLPGERVLCEYSASKEFTGGQWSGSVNNSRNCNLSNTDSRYVRICISMEHFNDCYLRTAYAPYYYFFKGNNVI